MRFFGATYTIKLSKPINATSRREAKRLPPILFWKSDLFASQLKLMVQMSKGERFLTSEVRIILFQRFDAGHCAQAIFLVQALVVFLQKLPHLQM